MTFGKCILNRTRALRLFDAHAHAGARSLKPEDGKTLTLQVMI